MYGEAVAVIVSAVEVSVAEEFSPPEWSGMEETVFASDAI
jgi:hypothetical protein